MKNKIVIAVGIAGHPIAAAGNSWAFLQWVLGFKEAGWEVWVVESLKSDQLVQSNWSKSTYEQSINKIHWESVMRRFGLENNASLFIDDQTPNLTEAQDFANEADVFLNVSGHFKSKALEFTKAKKVYLDLDPAFTQIWSEVYKSDMNFTGHDRFFTYGSLIGKEGCFAPTCGLEWVGIFPPVVLNYWPCQPLQKEFIKFSTLAHWQGYSWCEWKNKWFTGKSEEFMKLTEMPLRVPVKFEIATELEANQVELEVFRSNGWNLVSGSQISNSFESYENYLKNSSSEFSAAKGGYVLSQGGWFSDRSVCYLASGRPVVLQSTGIERLVPKVEGLHVFNTQEEASLVCCNLVENFEQQQRAARALAERYFDSHVVIAHMLNHL